MAQDRNDDRDAPLEKGPPPQQQPWPGRTGDMHPPPDHGEKTYRGSGKLEGRAALVTGGDSGIGRAVAIAFAREGADVAIGYLSEHDDAAETARWVREAGRRATTISADLTRPEECRRLVDEAVGELGRIDVLVNNAAFQWEVRELTELSPEQVERTFRTNIFAYIYVAQAAVEHMRQGGVILNTGSVTALEGNKGLIDYSSTKGAIHTLTKSLAQALAEREIRVCCVAPGPVWTPLIPSTFGEGHVDRFGATTFRQRPAQPAEIAPSYVFLASQDGAFYNGEVLAPTGRETTR
jgi:hypothetical protein